MSRSDDSAQPAATQTRDIFEREFAREILASERIRATVLAVLFGLLGLAALIGGRLFQSLLRNVFRGDFPILAIVGIAGGITVAQVGLRLRLGALLKQGRQPPVLIRYVNALLEISAVSGILAILAPAVGPALVLVSPPAGLYFIFIVASILRLDFRLSAFTGLVAGAELVGLALVQIPQAQASLPTPLLQPIFYVGKGALLLLTGLVAGAISQRIRQQVVHALREVEERQRVIGIFGQHVSPQVVNRLLEQYATGNDTQVRDVCIMFVDIRDFTTYAEAHSAEEVVAYLNTLFGSMIDIVNQHDGIINKFLGDGFMAVFGAPIQTGQDTINGLRAALDILKAVEEQSARGIIPPTQIGIGLHRGQAVTGSIGSEHRKEYTVIGDVVNLASRIEQLNKQFGTRLLISEAVMQAGPQMVEQAVSLGAVQVKGHAAPVSVYRVA